MIISVLNQKGGVGKTTLSVNIAARLAADGARVLLLDADPQGSALDWAAAR
ncbi:AAA family ATPase, partial [Klebsiella pneumoniae]